MPGIGAMYNQILHQSDGDYGADERPFHYSFVDGKWINWLFNVGPSDFKAVDF